MACLIHPATIPAGPTPLQVFDMTAPPSPNPLPPVNDASAALPPPPAAPVVPVGALIPAISENFNGAAPYKYTLGQFNNAAATVNYPPGGADGGSVLRATVTATGGAAWHLQLTSAFVPFQAAESYSLRLRASAAAPGGVPVGVNVLFLRETTYALLGLRCAHAQRFSVAPFAPTRLLLQRVPLRCVLPGARWRPRWHQVK